MATAVEEFSEKKKKRKRKGNEEEINRRKLLVGEKVEVRSVEEGFCGSWHSAIVVACGDSIREVRYENLLNDYGSGNLTEFISVSSVIEGVIPEKGVPLNHRGLIRPLVLGEEVCKLGLYYGLCVDALIDDAWWEGVIFDYEDGSEKRLVFFPDLGDEVEVEVKHLRITRDWDEVKENWNIRGSWLFLEWMEKYEEEWPILVSVKQIWYELRGKEEFQINIKDWTYCVKSMWEDLVIEVIDDNLYLTADHVLNMIHSEMGVDCWIEGTSRKRRQRESSMECSNKRTKIWMGFSNCNPCEPTVETQFPVSSLAEPLESSSAKHEMVPAQSVSVKQLEECNITQLVSGEPLGPLDAPLIENRERCGNNDTVQLSPHVKKVDALDKALLTNTHCSCDDLDFSVYHEEGEDQEARRIADDTQRFNGCRNYPMCDDPIHNSPCSNLYLSHGNGDSVNNTLSKEDVTQGVENVSRISEDAICSMQKDQHKPSKSRKYIPWVPAGKNILTRPQYCPEALIEYLFDRKRTSEVKVHLLQLGWKIDYHNYRNGVKYRYISPEGKILYSLRSVCGILSQQTEMGDTLTSRNGCPSLVEDASGDQLDSSLEQVILSRTLDQPQGWDSGPYGEAQVMDFSKREVGSLGDAFHNAQLLDSHISDKKVAPVVPDVLLVKEYDPQAVFDLIAYEPGRQVDSGSDIRCLSLKARKHLSAHGWTSHVNGTGRKDELCFMSPMRRVYSSLLKACKGYLEEEVSMEQMKGGMDSDKEIMDSSVGDKFSSASRLCSNFVESKHPMNSQMGKTNTESSCSSQSRNNGNMQHKSAMQSLRRRWTGSLTHAELLPCQPNYCVQGTSGSSLCIENLEFGNAQDERAGRNQWKRKKVSSFSLRLRRSKSVLLSGRQNENAKKFYYNGKKRCLVSQELKKLKRSGSLMEQIDQLGSYPAHILPSCRREQQVVASNPAQRFPRSVLSWLIDNNILLPRAKAHYLSRKDHHLMAEGRITRHGIKCNCCRKVYGLSSFESHAGSKSKRPSANIFLEDGRSLLDCQKQVVQGNILKGFTQQQHKRIKCNQPHKENDYICSVCHYGGRLVLCDQCPSSFHLSCLGLEDLPKGKWFCPSCRCGICGQSEFNGNLKQFTEKTVLYCDQCRHEYHVGCIRKRGQSKLESCPKKSWFCSKKCEKIFVTLHKVLGTSIPVGVDNLSWTILKSLKEDYHDSGVSDNEAITENQMKLNVALAVMHECFEPIREPRTKRDIVKDVLFNNISELNRLNFWGFYTVILEREDEIISVATLRIHGEKVAEIPLICTCVQYRGQGMCRILLNVLEKKLGELEVERLFLPAVPQVLQTWTGHFGFSKVAKSERLEFLQYSFLDFQDTTMCQKMLRMAVAAKSTEPRAGDELSHIKENMDMIRHNSTSEVVQAEQIEQFEKLEQLPLYVTKKVLQAKNMLKSSDKEDNQQMPEAGIVQKCILKKGDESDNQQNYDGEKCSPRSSNDREDNTHEKCTVRSSDKKKEDNLSNGFLVYKRRRTAVRYSEAITDSRNCFN